MTLEDQTTVTYKYSEDELTIMRSHLTEFKATRTRSERQTVLGETVIPKLKLLPLIAEKRRKGGLEWEDYKRVRFFCYPFMLLSWQRRKSKCGSLTAQNVLAFAITSPNVGLVLRWWWIICFRTSCRILPWNLLLRRLAMIRRSLLVFVSSNPPVSRCTSPFLPRTSSESNQELKNGRKNHGQSRCR